MRQHAERQHTLPPAEQQEAPVTLGEWLFTLSSRFATTFAASTTSDIIKLRLREKHGDSQVQPSYSLNGLLGLKSSLIRLKSIAGFFLDHLLIGLRNLIGVVNRSESQEKRTEGIISKA